MAEFKEIFAIVFDLEATGLSTQQDEVTQIAAALATISIDDHKRVDQSPFSALVKCNREISEGAQRVTGLTNEKLKDASCFRVVLQNFAAHIEKIASSLEDPNIPRVLVAYNGAGYDLPLLLNEISRHFPDALAFLRQLKISYFFDPLTFCRVNVDESLLPRNKSGRASFKLGDVHQCLLARPLEGAHEALADSVGLLDVICHPSLCHVWADELVRNTGSFQNLMVVSGNILDAIKKRKSEAAVPVVTFTALMSKLKKRGLRDTTNNMSSKKQKCSIEVVN